MPQGRKKTPFSGKAKKEQLKAKKQSKSNPGGSKVTHFLKHDEDAGSSENKYKINAQPDKSGKGRNRYILQFHKESNEEITRRKEIAMQSLVPVDEKQLEFDADFFTGLDFPRRPDWSFEMSKEALERQEHSYFNTYIKALEDKCSDFSYFELNLETWRQLWRVLEISDVVLLITDIRFAILMFPPSLYDYVTNVLKKQMILILNKIDLAPPPLVAAWRNYFLDKYVGLNVLMFTSIPSYNLMGKSADKGGLQIRQRRGRMKLVKECSKLLLEACKGIVKEEVDLSSWEQKIEEEYVESADDDASVDIGEIIKVAKNDTSYHSHKRFNDGILTIGCCGQPNVGKSSLLNAIMGKKVVSVSRTPGHTKHFQTIFLTQNVRLCDCPGLVFPSRVPKELQILMGSFPIAQLREPYTPVKFIAERLDLPQLLRLQHPEDDDTWSAMDVCNGWAKKRGFYTAKAARLDTYRAANNLLRMQLDGKICLCLRPVGYLEKYDYWLKHPDVGVIQWITGITMDEIHKKPDIVFNSDDDEDELGEEEDDEEGKSDEDTDDSNESEVNELKHDSNPFSALSNE